MRDAKESVREGSLVERVWRKGDGMRKSQRETGKREKGDGVDNERKEELTGLESNGDKRPICNILQDS